MTSSSGRLDVANLNNQRLRLRNPQPELIQKRPIRIHPGIFRRQQLVTVENRIGPRKEAERLTLTRQPRPTRREPHARFG